LIQKIEMNVNKTNAFLFVAFAAGMLFYFGRRLACPKNDEDDDIEVDGDMRTRIRHGNL